MFAIQLLSNNHTAISRRVLGRRFVSLEKSNNGADDGLCELRNLLHRGVLVYENSELCSTLCLLCLGIVLSRLC